MLDEISLNDENGPKKDKLKTLFSLKHIMQYENDSDGKEDEKERSSSGSVNYGKIDMKMNA